MLKKHKNKHYIIYIVLVISISFNTYKIEGQTIYTKFGKNRVQYSQDFNNWWLYDTENYSIYWYTKELNLAKSVILLSQASYTDIEDILDFKINKKIKIIIYSDIGDFNQTNLGIKNEFSTNETGSSKTIDNKIIIYFDGDFSHLLNQIREGTAAIFLKNMFSNISIENVYNNLISNKIPDWFTKGAAAYLSNKWDIQSDARLRQFIISSKNKKAKFKYLAQKMPKLAGKSFFNFITNKYNIISDLFYLLRITRNLNNSIKNTTGKSIGILYNEWYQYYIKIYSNELSEINSKTDKSKNKIITSNNNNTVYPSVKINDSNKYLAYSSDKYGKKELNLINLKRGIKTTLYSSGYINKEQISDFNYPIFSFFPSSNKIAFIYKLRDVSYLKIVNYKSKEVLYNKPLPLKIKSIQSFDIWDNENIIVSAIVNGNIDLFKFDINKRNIKQITDDFWVERDIKTVTYKNKRGILFSSNRIDTTLKRENVDTILPTSKFDIFFLNITLKNIKRFTSTPEINETFPYLIDDNLIYKTDETGITNIKINNLNSHKSTFSTNNNFNIFNIFPTNKRVTYSENNICYNSISTKPYEKHKKYMPKPTFFIKNNKIQDKKTIKDVEPLEIEKGLLFQSKFNSNLKNNMPNKISQKYKKHTYKRYISSHAIASRLKFSFSKFTTRLDNEPLFEGLSIYTEDEANYTPPKAGILSKVLIKDMFEDYFIETGLRISPDFNEKEYFSVFENLRHQVDWQYVYYRKSNKKYKYLRQNIIDKYNTTSNLFRVRAKYPFSVFKSISMAANLRIDKINLYASDTISLNDNSNKEQRISLKFEYIFDNTSRIGINLLEGNRSKIFMEVYNKFNFSLNSNNKFSLSKGFMTVLGYDFRHYFKIINHSVLAFRAAGQTSFGSESNIYFLGGIENWQFSKYENEVQAIKNEKIAYKILAANLRGFGYNAKSGSSFAIFSSELRIPIIKYFINSNKPFLRDFQLNFFLDAGMTWNGISPFSKENTSNIKYIEVPPTIKLKLLYYSDPLIAGYGFGVRSTLFGYFLKLDYGWGIETRKIRKPILYFSIGHDF